MHTRTKRGAIITGTGAFLLAAFVTISGIAADRGLEPGYISDWIMSAMNAGLAALAVGVLMLLMV